MNTRILIWLLAAFSVVASAEEQTIPDYSPFKLITKVEHQPIAEMSGLIKSRTFENVYWAHNDSGDSARLFAVNRDGKVIFPGFLGRTYHGEQAEPNKTEWPGLTLHQATNIDWEDIAVDGDRLLIADVGNNGNARRDMGIYVLSEPNPRSTYEARVLRHIPIAYPEQQNYPATHWHFDSESIFVDRGKIYLITKHREDRKIGEFESGANLYRLDSEHSNKINYLEKVDHLDSLAIATGADLSPDGKHLAVITYVGLWVFDKPQRGDKWLSSKARFAPIDHKLMTQMEAVTWDDNKTILISNEGRQVFEINLDQLDYADPD